VEQLAGLPASHRLHLDQHVELLVVRQLMHFQKLVLEVLVQARII
jgi:hypothetical protein